MYSNSLKKYYFIKRFLFDYIKNYNWFKKTSYFIACVNILISIFFVIYEPITGIFLICILLLTRFYSKLGEAKFSQERISISNIVTFIYVISAIIISSCFSKTQFFLVSDPTRYIRDVCETTDLSFILQDITDAYIGLADNNGLYNAILKSIGLICSKYNVIPSSFLITLPQVFFGIISVITLFRILSNKFDGLLSIKFTIRYAVLSLLLLYSCIIVRDVIIAFCYILCIEIILKPFRINKVIILILIMIFCIGIRLFSGLFIFAFIAYYIFINLRNKLNPWLLYPFLFLVFIFLASYIVSDQLYSQTIDEIDTYTEWQVEVMQSGETGLSSKLRNLPLGLNYIGIFLLSQLSPFPPYGDFFLIYGTDLIPKIYISMLQMVSSIWWYFVSYTLLYVILFKKAYKRLGFNNCLLLCLAWFLIIISSTMHMDIRRIMPIYPIIYVLYLLCKNKYYSQASTRLITKNLFVVYLILNFAYILIK